MPFSFFPKLHTSYVMDDKNFCFITKKNYQDLINSYHSQHKIYVIWEKIKMACLLFNGG